MKILLISSQDYIHHPIPSRHHYIFERLADKHEVHVAHFHISDERERKTKLIVEEATMFNSKSLIPHYVLNSPYHFYKFDKIIKEHNIDVIVAAHVLAGTAAILAGKRNNIPVLFDLKDWFPDSAAAYFKNPILKRAVRNSVMAITRFNLSHSTQITTVSPNLVDKLDTLGYRSQLITNGVDTSIFKPMNPYFLRHMLGIEDHEFVVGFAGSIERWYDIDLLVDTINNYQGDDMKLLLVGGSLFTDYRDEIFEKVYDLGIMDKVIFAGIIPYHLLPDYINCMDVCTIPLIPNKWRDIALPNKFFEYTACGKPIVSSNIPNVIDFKSPNVFIYDKIYEFAQRIMYIKLTKPKFDIDFSKQDWNYKADEMEKVLYSLVQYKIEKDLNSLV